VTRIAKDTVAPDWTWVALACFVIVSRVARIRATAVAWAVLGYGSGPRAVAAAASMSMPGICTRTRAITVTVVPGATSPNEHLSDGWIVQVP
jgi:hypothetical protein